MNNDLVNELEVIIGKEAMEGRKKGKKERRFVRKEGEKKEKETEQGREKVKRERGQEKKETKKGRKKGKRERIKDKKETKKEGRRVTKREEKKEKERRKEDEIVRSCHWSLMIFYFNDIQPSVYYHYLFNYWCNLNKGRHVNTFSNLAYLRKV